MGFYLLDCATEEEALERASSICDSEPRHRGAPRRLAVETVSPRGDRRGDAAGLSRGCSPRRSRFTRSLPDAEDAVHDAIERALAAWPAGLPDSREAWLLSVAANCHRDRLRRAKREVRDQDALTALHDMSPWVRVAMADPDIARGWKDESARAAVRVLPSVAGSG